MGVVKSVEKQKGVAGQFAVSKSQTYYWTQKLNIEDADAGTLPQEPVKGVLCTRRLLL